MKTVIIEKPFWLQDGGVRVPYLPGTFELEDEIADHWYVKAHSKETVEQEEADDSVGQSGEPTRKVRRRVAETSKE